MPTLRDIFLIPIARRAALSLLVRDQRGGCAGPSSTILGHQRQRCVGQQPHPRRQQPEHGAKNREGGMRFVDTLRRICKGPGFG